MTTYTLREPAQKPMLRLNFRDIRIQFWTPENNGAMVRVPIEIEPDEITLPKRRAVAEKPGQLDDHYDAPEPPPEPSPEAVAVSKHLDRFGGFQRGERRFVQPFHIWLAMQNSGLVNNFSFRLMPRHIEDAQAYIRGGGQHV